MIQSWRQGWKKKKKKKSLPLHVCQRSSQGRFILSLISMNLGSSEKTDTSAPSGRRKESEGLQAEKKHIYPANL